MKLYGYWRSSAAYRVRIALNLKGISCEQESVHLVKDGGEQHKHDYVDLNPNELVPTLVDGELKLNQSMAILEYLEAKFTDTPLLPTDLEPQVRCRALALDIACDTHPLNNLRILQYLSGTLSVTDEEKMAWYHHWIHVGFSAFEKSLKTTAGKYCFGDTVTWADICLVPQVYNAERFGVDLSAYPILMEVCERCRSLPAFIDALPENQPDAT